MEEEVIIRRKFRKLERDVLILIAIPLPAFAFSYLYSTSQSMHLEVPELPAFLNSFSLGLVFAILVYQHFEFHKRIDKIKIVTGNLDQKMGSYAKATINRFWQLFLVGVVCAAGLLIYDNAGYTIAYVVALVFISIGKPTPDRIIRLLQLKGEEKKKIYAINKRE